MSLKLYKNTNNLTGIGKQSLSVNNLLRECKEYIRDSKCSEEYFDQSAFVASFYGNDTPNDDIEEDSSDEDNDIGKKNISRKRNKTSSPIVFRISYNTDVGDIETKVQLARKQLEERNLVVFKMNLKNLGIDRYKRPPVFEKIIKLLRDIALPTGPESVTEHHVMLTLKNKLPINRKIKNKTNE